MDYKDFFAVIRVDFPLPLTTADPNDVRNRITIKEVLPTAEEAAHEVDRLNELNGDKQCLYVWNKAKVFPEGRGYVESD